MIQIRNLQFIYPDGFGLKIPEFQLKTGEKVAVIGPSGSGKTTLLNLISGVLIPTSGTVEAAGQTVSHLSDRERRGFRISRIGFVFQDFELLDYLNVIDNVLITYRINDALKLDSQVRQRAVELLQSMGLGNKQKRSIYTLSQGERQRVAICRALLSKPELILADEATGNLDPENKQHILDLLFDAVNAHGATLLAVTHDHDLLPRFDRVVDFNDFRNPGEPNA